MEPELNTPAPQGSSLLFKLVVTALLIVAVGTAYVLFNNREGGFATVPANNADRDPFAELSGYIYFSDNDPVTNRSFPAVYDIAKGESTNFPNDPSNYYRSIIPVSEGARATLVAKNGIGEAGRRQLYVGPLHVLYPAATDGAPDVTATAVDGIPSKGNLRLSQEAHLYMVGGISRAIANSKEESYYTDPVVFSDPATWSVYLLDFDGNEVAEIPGAGWATWAPNGLSFYFVGEGGVYEYVLATQAVNNIIPFTEMSAASSIAVTKDNSTLYLVYAGREADRNTLYTYSLNHSAGVTEAKEIDSYGLESQSFQVTLSPDENYLGFVTYSNTENIYNVIDLRSQEKKVLFSRDILNYHDLAPFWSDINPY